MSQVVGLDMVTGMGFIGLEPGRLYKIGQSPKLKDQTASGNPLLINSAEAPLTALSLYGWSKQDGTPSPDNPVPIVSAGSVMVESKNLCNMPDVDEYVMRGVTYSCKNGAVTANGTATDGESITISGLSYDLPITAGTYYVSGSSDVLAVYVRVTKSDGSQGYYSSSIFTLDGTETRCVVYVRVAEGATANNVTAYPMINAGSTALPYEPYFAPYADPEAGEINVTVLGGNLFDTSIIPPLSSWDGESEGVFVKDENTLFVKIPSNNSVAKIIKTDGITAKWHELLPNVSVGDQIVFGHGTDDITNYFCYSLTIGVIRAGNVITVTEEFLNENANLYGAGVGSTVDRIELTINYGSTALSYMPYKTPQTLTAQTPGGLPGIPVSSGGNYTDESGQQWVCDEKDFKRGKYVQRVWRKTFDGSEDENWIVYGESGSDRRGFACLSILLEDVNRKDGLSNQFVVGGAGIAREDIVWIGVNNKNIYTLTQEWFDKGIDAWKAHLAAHPLEVMTYLETPIETDIPAEEIAAYKALHTYSPATTVSNDADVRMGVGYKK